MRLKPVGRVPDPAHQRPVGHTPSSRKRNYGVTSGEESAYALENLFPTCHGEAVGEDGCPMPYALCRNNKNMLKKLILLLISCAIFSHAADGTWIDTTGGTRQWQDASNWQDGTVPSGYGSTASFFSAMPASVIYLPETAEVGSLDVVASGTATGFEFRDGLLTLDGSSPVVNASTRDFFCRTPLAGTNGFTKTGSRSFRPYRFSQMSGAITLHSGILGLDFRQAANSTNYLATNLMHPDGVLLGSSSPQIRIGGRPNAVQRSGAWVVTVGSKIATYVSGDNASTLSCGQKLSENTSFPTGTFLEVIYDNTTIGLSQSAVQSATESLTFESASFKTRQEFDLFDTGTGQGGSIYLNDVDDDTRIVLKELQGRKPLTVSGPGRVEIGVTGEFSSYVKLSDGNLTLADQRAMLDAPAVGAAFHVDASCTNTMVLIPYNDGYLVDRWNDKNSTPVLGQSYIRYAQSNTRGAFAPLLVENALNGLPVVDFGSPGSLMGAVWSEPLNGIKTVFWVVGSQNGGGMLLGSKDNAPLSFERGMDVFKCKDYAAKSYTTPLTMDHALFFTLSDDNRCWINGGEVDHQYSGLSGGFDLVSFVWGEDDVGGSASAFAMRQNMSSYPERSGGQRLAEVIVYQRELSEQERMDTEAYLSWKWFGRQMPGYGSPRIGNVVQESGSSSVVQESTEEMTIDHLSVVGDLSIQSCSNVSLPAADLNAGSLILNGGAVEISTRTVPSAIAEGHALHLDASDADSFTISAGKVTQWRDSSGGSHYAFNNFGSEAQPGIINGAQNGLPVVDFGVIGSGEHLCWDTNINVRSLFMVMSVKSSATTPLGSYVPMLSKGHFSRVNSGGMIWSPTVGDLSVHEGTAYLNGVACKPTHTELPNNQFVLVTENLQGTALACAFGGEAYNYLNAPLLRKERTGGLQLGEVIIYDRRVSDQERRDIEAYLYLKWFGEVMPGYALGTGSKLAESISVSNSARLNLIGNGSVFVDELVASSGLVVSNEGYFTANAYSGSGDFLKMGAGTLDLSTAAPLEGRITVEDGTLCITGSVDLLRVDQDGVVDLGGGSISTEFLGGSGVIDNGDCKVSYLRTDPSGSALNTLRCGGNLFFPEDAVYEVGVNTEHTVSCVDVAGELVVEGQGSILLPVWLKTLPAGHYKLFSFGSISEDSSRNLVNSWQVASALRPGLTEKIKVIDQGVYLYIAHTGTVVMVDGPAPVKDYDVVVVGGGSAGFGAAYSAALLGAKTALVEREHMLGGTSTICGVNNWEPGIGGTGVCYRIYQRMTQITNAIAVMSQDRHVSTYDPDVEPYRFPGGLYVPDPTMSYSDSLRRYGPFRNSVS